MALTKITNRTFLPSRGEAAIPVYADKFNTLINELEAARTNSTEQSFSAGIKSDTISEYTSATGVTVDGVLLKDGTINYKEQVTDTGGAYATPVVLTTAQSGRKILVDDAAGLDFTLPAIGAGDIGTFFEFLVTVSVTSNNFRVTAAAGDLLNGGIELIDDTAAYTAPQAVVLKPDFTDDLIMTMNGTTTGGKKGTSIKFEAVSATQWFVTGKAFGSGVLATPFS